MSNKDIYRDCRKWVKKATMEELIGCIVARRAADHADHAETLIVQEEIDRRNAISN